MDKRDAMGRPEKETAFPQKRGGLNWDFLASAANRMIAWGALFLTIYILRSFFMLVFFTFVFAYIQLRGVYRLERLIKNRTIRVVVTAFVILGILTAALILLVPKVKQQTEIFIASFSGYVTRMDQELFEAGDKYPILKEIMPQLRAEWMETGVPESLSPGKSPTMGLLQELTGLAEGESGVKNVNQVIEKLGGLSGKIASATSSFVLALLFSFLIVLDMPHLQRQVTALQNTKLRFIYIEVAEGIKNFSNVLGKSLEAQLIIAIVNSFLTAIGILMLGIGQSVAFLSVIVLFCSFIPVAGVFISSIPICLIALQTSGLHTMLLAIVMIVVIHLMESYILNPRIYGTYMRINPVIVLIILTIGGKLFHIWGLILGVPVCTYIFGYAIKNRQTEDEAPVIP
ncbi:MAG: AI-2E family transporter [Desulfobacteraceae bacterium]|nr:MAG: AI-2E family transporter [Desulfobacteraceae bacterium]